MSEDLDGGRAVRAIVRFALWFSAIVVIGAAVFGLVHYRHTLDHCDKAGCSCVLFGQTVQGGNCSHG